MDGTILTEVKQGKDGASIKLADRMKALEWLAEHMDLATDEQKARIAAIKEKCNGDTSSELVRVWAEKVMQSRRKAEEQS
jgi:phage terminase small subunit